MEYYRTLPLSCSTNIPSMQMHATPLVSLSGSPTFLIGSLLPDPLDIFGPFANIKEQVRGYDLSRPRLNPVLSQHVFTPNGRRTLKQQVRARTRLWERDNVPDRGGLAENCHQAIEA